MALMGGKTKNYPSCPNASDPYHECGDLCLNKSYQTNGRANKKLPVPEKLSKIMGEDKRVHPECPNASNPYHECAAYCLEKLKINKSVPQKGKKDSGFIFLESPKKLVKKKKKKDSKSHHISSEPSDISSQSSSSMYSSERKSEINGEKICSSWRDFEEEIRSRHSSFDKMNNNMSFEELGSPKDIPMTAPLKVNTNLPPILPSPNRRKPEEGEDEDIHALIPEVISPSRIGIEQKGGMEKQVLISDSKELARIYKYHVKGSFSILEKIFEKNGDILAACQLESISIRSYYLGCLVSVIEELQSTPFIQLNKSKIREMYAILKDVESARIEVGWLRNRLDDLGEAIELIDQHNSMDEAKAECDHELESTRKELDARLEDLARKEREISDAAARIAQTRKRLSELEFRRARLDDTVSSTKSKVEDFQKFFQNVVL